MPADPLRFDLLLIGFGHVARRFVRLLEERRSRLAAEHTLTTRVVGISTRRHGSAFAGGGLDVDAALKLVERGQSLDALRSSVHTTPPSDPALALIEGSSALTASVSEQRLVAIETTVLDIKAGQPAIDYVAAALRTGAHVVTANKGPVAFAYRRLRDESRSARRAFLFEGAVMDGVPVFNLVRETLPGVEVIGFRGVVNSTTNYILSAMEAARDREEALAEMQARGIAEADASFDLDGWDAAAKTAALVNVLLGGEITPHDVERMGIGDLTGEETRTAVTRGERIRLVASAERRDGGTVAQVRPVALPQNDVLAGLSGMENALVLKTDLLGEIAIVQLGGGLTQTAYALLSDLIAIRRQLVRGTFY